MKKGLKWVSGFNQQFLLSVMIIILGFTIKRLGWLGEQEGDGISRLIFNVTLPSLIIYSFHDLTIEPSLFLLVLSGVLYGFLLMGFGYLFFGRKLGKTKGMLLMMMPGLNIGLFAYPLVEGLFGSKGIQYFGMLDVGNALITFGVCYIIGIFYGGQNQQFDTVSILKKLTRSVPLMTYMIIFLLAVMNVNLPGLVIDTAEVVSRANMPLSLLVLGMFIHIQMAHSERRELVQFLFARFGVGLIVGLSCYFFLPVSEMVKLTLLIGAILPLPLSHLPYAVEFDYSRRFVGTTSSFSLVISFVLIWLVATLAM